MATVTVTGITTDTTFTATYSNVTATCTVTVAPTYLFYDSGVTGTKNTNFIFNGTTTYCQVTTDANGTVFLYTRSGQGDYIPNIDISQYANLEISWIFTYGTRYACQTTLLNSNKTSPNDTRWHNEGTSTPTKQWYIPNGSKSITHTLTVGDTMKLVKTNNTFSFYCNDELISTVTPNFTVAYIGFTSADNNRPFGYRELKIAESL